MIVYVALEVQIHGLEIVSMDEVEQLRSKIETAIREMHPSLRFDDDVRVELIESAGETNSDRE